MRSPAAMRSHGQEQPRLYNLLENLCISRGITMPRLKVMDTDALNAFASGLNQRQYAVSVTRGLVDRLDDAELEAVLGHELTHIRNGDVRMMVIAVVIAGVISFFAEMFFRMMFHSGIPLGRTEQRRRPQGIGRRVSRDPHRGGADRGRLVAVLVIRFALSRSREFLADAGAVELTKNPDAMITALRKIEGRGELRRLDLGRHGDVRRQSALGLRRSVRHPSVDRQARRRAGPVCRRPRSRADCARTAGAGRGSRRHRTAKSGGVPPNSATRHTQGGQARYPRTSHRYANPEQPRPMGTAAAGIEMVSATSDRPGHRLQRPPRGAAEDEFAQARMAVAAHDDEVGRDVGRVGEIVLGDVAIARHDAFDVHLCAMAGEMPPHVGAGDFVFLP